MASPFPGMDPYIEECGLWESFHFNLISRIQDDLSDRLPDHYRVRVGERAYIVLAEPDGKSQHVFLPDVPVSGTRPVPSPSSSSAAAEVDTGTDSVSMRAFIATEYRENFIEIYVAEPERMLVTCIEVLSPANKRRNSPGWDLYLRKRQGLLLGAANLVEIDLLRGGDRFPMIDPWPNCPYTLLVARRTRAPYCRVWPAHYLRPLPPIPVPLSAPDPDVTIELQPMIDAIYTRSRYERDIDYTRPLSLPLPEADAAWLSERLRERSVPPASASGG